MQIDVDKNLLAKAKELSGIDSDKEVTKRALELLIQYLENASPQTKRLLNLA